MSLDPDATFSEVSETPSPISNNPLPPTGGTPGNPSPSVNNNLPPAPLSPADERTWAFLAHLSVLLNLVTGLLGVGAAFVIFLLFRERSRYVAFQALQAALFQLICWAGIGALIGLIWGAIGILSMIMIGILLIPIGVILTLLLAVMPIASVVYGIFGAYETSQGTDFRYWMLGDWVAQMLI